MCRLSSCLLILIAATSSAAVASPDGGAPGTATRILEFAGIHGGVIVHLGCGRGDVTAALRVSDAFTVHGLQTDAAAITAIRTRLLKSGLYGDVTVETLAGTALPYRDNLINLVVVDDACGVPTSEIIRVLAPRGVAVVASTISAEAADGDMLTIGNRRYRKIVKPWPDTMDEWSHYLHDASNNAVADDELVGPPRSLQWIAGPLWLRSHETPSGIESPVSSGGRLFYILDEGLIGITDERIPDRWALVCRDAFNGRQLWKRRLGAWGWREWSYDRYAGKDWTTLRAARTDVPSENQRRVVADGNFVYTTLSYNAPLSVLNAATGETIVTIEETKGTREIVVDHGVAVVYVRSREDTASERRGKSSTQQAHVIAVKGATGQVLWDHSCGSLRSLSLAIDAGRVIYAADGKIIGRNLRTGKELWQAKSKISSPQTLLVVDDVVVVQAGRSVEALNAANGSSLWQKQINNTGGYGEDLFVINGLVWRGMQCVDETGKPTRKSENALAVGFDLRTGEEKQRILVKNLRSPEHHHRCYRNKATERFLISSYEGAEFLDLRGEQHGQNNFLRGACKNGMMPCNGMLYAPPDQCFCQPGAKLLGYAALTAESSRYTQPNPQGQRLSKGPAYGVSPRELSTASERADAWWPTFRHDAARSGSTTASVDMPNQVTWQAELGGRLTAPVAADGKVFVAQSNRHTLYALDEATGAIDWQFTTNGRIDSPPTIYRGAALFGSKDGYVYCVRADDGQLMWRFLAAPADQRVGYDNQLESAWPVHGSVLILEDIAYVTAGRSTYLDGGIRLYGLNPRTGEVLYRGLLEGPHRSVEGERDLAFFIRGANSDVLVAQEGAIYMRQKKLTPELKEVDIPVLSSKGAQDVGLHLFSTSGLLDGSWYNRTFWMYSKRWPGFQLANQAPKAGQLIVFDEKKTYALKVFTRRNTHSPMFFPATDGYLLFADWNTNEPQIVGEAGSRPPLAWMPQTDYSRGRGTETRKLDSEAFGLDKMVGYTRAEPEVWQHWIPVRVRGMVKTRETLFVAGSPDELDVKDPYAAFEGRRGARLVALSAETGNETGAMPLDSPPVFDGLIAANGSLFIATENGHVAKLHAR